MAEAVVAGVIVQHLGDLKEENCLRLTDPLQKTGTFPMKEEETLV